MSNQVLTLEKQKVEESNTSIVTQSQSLLGGPSDNILDSDVRNKDIQVSRRGRPRGSGGKASSFEHYKPRRWHPEFDLIVIESISGSDNETIGRKYGYTKEHVSNILSTSQAREIKEKVRHTVDKEFEGTLKQRLAVIGEKTVKHIENFINDEDNLAARSPFMFIDRTLKIAQSVGTLIGDRNNNSGQQINVAGNAIIMNNEKADDLKKALSDSMELEYVEIKKVG